MTDTVNGASGLAAIHETVTIPRRQPTVCPTLQNALRFLPHGPHTAPIGARVIWMPRQCRDEPCPDDFWARDMC